MISILFLYALCASSFTISKAILVYSAPFFFVGIRMLVSGILLLSFAYSRKEKFIIERSDWLLFFSIIFFHIYCAYIFDAWSLQYMSSFKSSFFFNASSFITAFLSWLFLHDAITKKKVVGMIIGFVGFIPMIAQQIPQEDSMYIFLGFSWPEVGLLVAITSSCLGWISMKKLMQDSRYSPLFINGVGMLGGGLLALVTSYLIEPWSRGVVSDWFMFAKLTALIVIICNILFYNLYSYLLKKYSATFLSFAGMTTSLFAALFGVLFLGETITWHFFVSTAIVGLGLSIFYQEELARLRI